MSTTTSPNGVAVDREGKHLIVSHVNIETISVYRIEEVRLSKRLILGFTRLRFLGLSIANPRGRCTPTDYYGQLVRGQ